MPQPQPLSARTPVTATKLAAPTVSRAEADAVATTHRHPPPAPPHNMSSRMQAARPPPTLVHGGGGGKSKGGAAGGGGGPRPPSATSGVHDQRAKTILKEAVDAVVNSFAKHTQGYGRGELYAVGCILVLNTTIDLVTLLWLNLWPLDLSCIFRAVCCTLVSLPLVPTSVSCPCPLICVTFMFSDPWRVI